VTVQVYPDQNSANLALSSGRADVVMADSPPAAYAVEKSNGQFKLTGKQYGTAAYGIAMPKNSGLAKPVLGALKAVMADGTYDRIFSYWVW
jgi:polar amino acid transport system substrate-binding protein